MLFFNRSILPSLTRNFQPSYLKDEIAQKYFETHGYVIIKNLIKEEEISEALTMFESIKEIEGYSVNKIFESSGNFKSVELQKKVFGFIHQFMSKIANRFALLDNCDIGKGGAFFIKPNTHESKLEPHQDSPVIDETKTYAMFAWIPLQNIDENNGALYVLPKSHLFGNTYRSQHIPWAFRNSCKELWNHMIPLFVNKGDVVFFDPSIIHSSGINNSDSYRLVLCGAILPKNHQKIEYTINDKKIHQYFIDDKYWLDGGNENTLNRYKDNIMPYTFPNPIKNKDLNTLLQANKISKHEFN